jgi:hypothetical protein
VRVDYDPSTVLIGINLDDDKANKSSDDESLKEVKDYVHEALNEVKRWKAKI